MPDPVTYEGSDLEALAELPNYQNAIVDIFRPHLRGHVAELGAGIGSLSRMLLPLVDRLDLIEPSPNLIPRLSGRFAGDSRVAVFADTLEHWLSSREAASLDGAVMINTLEHVRDDGAALRELARVLRPGGRLMVFVPALPFLYSRLDAAIGHHRRYRRSELVAKVEAAGFEVLHAAYFDLLGILPWLLVHTLGGRTRMDPGAARLYDRVGVPLTRMVERALPVPVGKNVILVAGRSECAA
ncbi:MAG: class I SAM-dependent methyltransferase [Alphaproteobacteria bacterium]|nr:class I SAM-dependent methyltransferase [Alphaproteobacteria bacterium]